MASELGGGKGEGEENKCFCDGHKKRKGLFSCYVLIFDHDFSGGQGKPSHSLSHSDKRRMGSEGILLMAKETRPTLFPRHSWTKAPCPR